MDAECVKSPLSRMHVIYAIRNYVNDKWYIGKKSFSKWNEFDKYWGSGTLIKLAIKKHGIKNFYKQILDVVPEEKLNEAEIRYIRMYGVISPNGYNIHKGGAGEPGGVNHTNRGRKHTEEWKNKMSEMFKGRKLSEETKRKISKSHMGISHTEEIRKQISLKVKGRHFQTEESRRKISEAGKGRVFSEERRRRISEGNKGKIRSDETKRKLSEAWCYEKHMTPETIKKVADAHRGVKLSPEHCKKIGDIHRGKIVSEETRKKLSVAQKNRPPMSEETRKKLSEKGMGRIFSEESKKKMRESAQRRCKSNNFTEQPSLFDWPSIAS